MRVPKNGPSLGNVTCQQSTREVVWQGTFEREWQNAVEVTSGTCTAIGPFCLFHCRGVRFCVFNTVLNFMPNLWHFYVSPFVFRVPGVLVAFLRVAFCVPGSRSTCGIFPCRLLCSGFQEYMLACRRACLCCFVLLCVTPLLSGKCMLFRVE